MNIDLITNELTDNELTDNELTDGLYKIEELINRLSKTRDRLKEHMDGLLELKRKLLWTLI